MKMKNLNPFVRCSGQRRSFTMVELLVVISIIGILATLIIGGGVWAVNKAKVNETQGLLKTLDMAAEQFASDNPYGRIQMYIDRYGSFPPDELECYTSVGIPNSAAATGVCLSPVSGSAIVNNSTALPAVQKSRSRIQAFLLACKLASPEAARMIDNIDPRFVMAPEKDATGAPTQFFDRNGNGTFDEGDEQLLYLVDSWKMPLRYLNVRNLSYSPSSDQLLRENFSIWAIRKNGNKPVFFSFGPNGEEQMKSTEMWIDTSTPPAPCHDFAGSYGTAGVVDDVLNGDNIYSTDGLAAKLSTP